MSEKRNTLPQGWEWKKLGDLCDFVRGPFGGSLKKNIFTESGYAVYEQSHAIYSKFEEIRYFIDENKFQEMKRFELKVNSLIMSCSGTIGRVSIVPSNIQRGIINQALLMLTPIKNLDTSFLKLLMESDFFQNILSEYTTGAAINNVASVKVLKEIKIPLPPLEEQRRIVGVLDGLFGKIDTSIALLDESIASASSLMPSALNEVFEEFRIRHEMVAVKQVIMNIQTGTTPSKQIEKYYKVPLEIEWFSPSDFKEEKILHNSKNKLNKIALEERKVKFYDENSLLLVAIGATVGKIGVIREKATSNQQITALKFDDSINVDFAYYWFKHIKEFIIGQASTATLPIINQNGIKELPFIKVPLDIQTQTVAYLDALHVKADALKKAQEKKKEALLALKASLLESAFKGAL